MSDIRRFIEVDHWYRRRQAFYATCPNNEGTRQDHIDKNLIHGMSTAGGIRHIVSDIRCFPLADLGIFSGEVMMP